MQNSNDFQIKLVVNDEPISLNPFVQNMVRNVVFSLVTSLKLETEPEKIELTLTKLECYPVELL